MKQIFVSSLVSAMLLSGTATAASSINEDIASASVFDGTLSTVVRKREPASPSSGSGGTGGGSSGGSGSGGSSGGSK